MSLNTMVPDAMLIKTSSFRPAVKALEYRLNQLQPTQEQYSTHKTNFLSRVFKKYLHKLSRKKQKTLKKASFLFKEPMKNIVDPIKKMEVLKKEVYLISAYMNAKRKFYYSKKEHTDILNVYWYSKAELVVTDKISASLQHLNHEVSALEAVFGKPPSVTIHSE